MSDSDCKEELQEIRQELDFLSKQIRALREVLQEILKEMQKSKIP